jgi:hypothetical protein
MKKRKIATYDYGKENTLKLPCINCISLPICRALLRNAKVEGDLRYTDFIPRNVVLNLYGRCSSFRNYVYTVNEKDILDAKAYIYAPVKFENYYLLTKGLEYIANAKINQPQYEYVEPLAVKVAFLYNKYHCRLFKQGKLYEELTCRKKISIGICVKYMLAWYDKLGIQPTSAMASHSRDRQKTYTIDSIDDRIERVYPTKNVIYNNNQMLEK